MENASQRWTIGTTPVVVTAVAFQFGAILSAIVCLHVAYHQLAYAAAGPIGRAADFGAFTAFVFVGLNLASGIYDVHALARGPVRWMAFLSAWNAAFVGAILVAFLTKQADTLSRGAVVLSYAAVLPAALSFGLIVRLVRSLSSRGSLMPRRILIVGREAEIHSLLTSDPQPARQARFIDAIYLPAETEGFEDALARAVDRARSLNPDDVMVVVPMSEPEVVERCIDAFSAIPVTLHLLQERMLWRFREIEISSVGGLRGFVLSRPRLTPFDQFVKRCFDVCVTLVALVVLAPLFLAVAIAIRAESKGPVFFRQARYGFNQQPFRILKFRTMRTVEDVGWIRQTTKDDDRVTRVGAILRRTNLDELPQLVNVLMGQMSLVGPRPHAVSHNRYYEQRVKSYARRHNVKPGITGWAQVNGFRGETDVDEKMSARVSCDLYYLENWSVMLDIKILVRTLFSLHAYRNAY